MIPASFLIALLLTFGVIVNVVINANSPIIKNTTHRMIFNIALNCICGISWVYGFTSSILNNSVLVWILSIVFGMVLGFIVLIITWKQNTISKPDSSIKEVEYTLDTLIGMHGVIQYYYDSDSKYCGKLNDEVGTDVIVKIIGDVPYGSNFVIKEIKGCDIIAELAD